MFAIKAEVSDPEAEKFAFSEQKTMYGGKQIAKGDLILIYMIDIIKKGFAFESYLVNPVNPVY